MFFYIFLISVFLILYFFGKDIQNRWFAFLMNYISTPLVKKDEQYEELKRDLFKPLHSMQSHDPELRKKKAVKILEIGVGTGTNFSFYPDGSKLVVVDPNPHFIKYYNENRSKFTNIQSEEIIVSTGEEMNQVEDNSVDAVVITLVMCSILDATQLLKQIKRVLVPGGKFFFFEHIKEFDEKHSIRSMLQDLLTTFKVWPLLFDGCMLNRDNENDIKAAGFSDVDVKRIHVCMKNIFKIISPHLIGVATK